MARVTKKDVKDTGGARWNRPIKKGVYRAKIVDGKQCEHHKDKDCEVAVFRVDGDDDECPDGPVKIDFHCDLGWKTRNFLAIMDPEKLEQINALSDDDEEGVEYNMGDYKGELCRLQVGHWTGDDQVEHAQINKLLPLKEEDEEATEAKWKAKKGKKKPRDDDEQQEERPAKKKPRDDDEDRDREERSERRRERRGDDEPPPKRKSQEEDDDDSLPF